MRVAAMAGDTAERGDDIAFVVFIEVEIFFVDPAGHPVHAAGHVLLRFGVARKIQPVRGAVRGRSMTEATFHAERLCPAVHHFFQVVVADILWQHFEVVLGLFVLRAEGGKTREHEGKQANGDDDLFAMKHIRNFDPLI